MEEIIESRAFGRVNSLLFTLQPERFSQLHRGLLSSIKVYLEAGSVSESTVHHGCTVHVFTPPTLCMHCACVCVCVCGLFVTLCVTCNFDPDRSKSLYI